MADVEDSSDSDSSPGPKRRKRNPKKWKAAKIKDMKARGEAHITYGGHQVPERSTGEACR